MHTRFRFSFSINKGTNAVYIPYGVPDWSELRLYYRGAGMTGDFIKTKTVRLTGYPDKIVIDANIPSPTTGLYPLD